MRRIDIEEMFPSPVSFKINTNMKLFHMVINDALYDILDEVNESEKAQIYGIQLLKADPSEMDFNEYAFYVNGEEVYLGSGPEIDPNRYDLLEEFYLSLMPVFEEVFNLWRDKIVSIQDEIENKLIELKEKEDYLTLFEFFRYYNDKKGFTYVKKLAQRYPNSIWPVRLQKLYKGMYGWHKNVKMAKKMTNIERFQFLLDTDRF
ncbi:MAG: hypothetical protein K6C97_05810 [Treponema sp.]|nr:hypothetical protein [Treponema sp.]